MYAKHLCYVKNVCQFSARIVDWDPIFLYIIQKCTCTCTEEHEIKYECHDEQKQISPFAQGKVVTYMHDE